MATLVLTVIGDDRAGLVSALATAVAENGGNWEQSQMTELAGKFAGIVTVDVPTGRSKALVDALRPLDGLLDITIHEGNAEAEPADAPVFELDLVGNDRPGIVGEITGVLRQHDVSIEALSTTIVDAPMAGGRLFEAHATIRLPLELGTGRLREDLEKLAAELMVDLTLSSP